MAGKNQVTLTFAGDSQALERTLKNVGQSSRQAEQDLDRVGSGVSRLQGNFSRSARAADESADRIGRAGESADAAETRFTGLASGIDGVTTLMSDPAPQEMAQGIADLADGVANSAVPAIQGLKGGVGNLVQGFKTGEGAGGAFKRNLGTIGIAAAGATAVIGLLTYAIVSNAQAQEEARQRASEFADELERTNGDVGASLDNTIRQDEQYQRLRNTLNELGLSVEQYKAGLATGDIEAWAEAHGATGRQQLTLILSTGMLADAVEDGTAEYEANTAALGESVAALEDYSDALRAQFDPLFGMMDAQQNLTEAQREQHEAQAALNAAIREHGTGSLEAAEAQRQLTDADARLRDSVVDLEGAATDLRIAVENGTVSARDARSRFIEMATSMGVSRGQAERLASQFLATTKEAQRLGGQKPTVHVSQTGGDKVLDKLRRVEDQINKIPKRINVNVFASLTGSGAGLVGGKRQHGGPVASGRLYEVAEHGKAELLEMGAHTYLIPGTDGRVVPADHSGGLRSFMHESGRPTTNVVINLNVQGSIRSDRDLIELVRDELAYGGFGGALR